MPAVQAKTNRELVLSLNSALNVIELCQVEIQALEHCIEHYNQQGE